MIISEWKLKDLLPVPLSWELSNSCVYTFAARRKSISTFKLRIRILWVCWCGGAWTLSKCYYMTYYRVQWERRVGSDSNMTWRRTTRFITVSVTQLEMVTQCCPYFNALQCSDRNKAPCVFSTESMSATLQVGYKWPQQGGTELPWCCF